MCSSDLKQARAPACRLLAAAAGIDDAIVARLADARKEIRATAAEWIGERGMKSAVPALKTALKKEKSEEGRAALLTALARLGEDISDHFSQKALTAEAERRASQPHNGPGGKERRLARVLSHRAQTAPGLAAT